MDELIKKENGKYKKYEELLLKRDQLNKEAGAAEKFKEISFAYSILSDSETLKLYSSILSSIEEFL